MSSPARSPKLYLVLPDAKNQQKLIDLAKKCQSIGKLGAVLLEYPRNPNSSSAALGRTVSSLQALGIATLVRHNGTLARTLKADGVHLTYTQNSLQQYVKIRKELGKSFIVGADAGNSRHDAMCLGEEGADYIAFGKKGEDKKRVAESELQCELVSWWSDLFEIPCVAMDIETPLEARILSRAGADFIAIKLPQVITSKTVENFLEPYLVALRS